jgi:hypothetical protein
MHHVAGGASSQARWPSLLSRRSETNLFQPAGRAACEEEADSVNEAQKTSRYRSEDRESAPTGRKGGVGEVK